MVFFRKKITKSSDIDNNLLVNEYLEKIKVPNGNNPGHKKLLLEKIRKEEISFSEKSIKKKVNNFRDFIKYPVLKYGFSIFFIIIIGIIFFSINMLNEKNKIVLTYNLEKGLSNKQKTTGKIKEFETLATEKDSELSISIENSSINLYDYSEIKILNNKKINGNNISRFKLLKGKIYCSVNLPTKNSIFEIQTDNAIFSVKGTKFYIEMKDNNYTILLVDEGIVEVRNNIQIDKKVNKIRDTENYKKIESIINIKEYIKQNEKIIINRENIIKFENELKEIIDKIINEKEISEEIINLESQSKNIFEKEEIQNDKNIKEEGENDVSEVKEVITINQTKFSNIDLKETGTGICAFENNLFVASDFNKTVYCINPLTGDLKWSFKNNKIKSITSMPFRIKNNIVIGSPDRISVLNDKGNIVSELSIKKGINYWPEIIGYRDKIYIPTSQNIYIFDNLSFNQLENFPDSNGQLYISKYDNKLYCFDLNNLDIQIYDLVENKITGNFKKMQGRSFMSPLILNNNLFISDINGNIYKYNLFDVDLAPQILSLPIGIINMIGINNNLYFIANDGFFYKINGLLFDSIVKITKVDTNPDPDKYLTKKPLLDDDNIYFSSDTGKLFQYSIKNNTWKYFIKEYNNNIPLVGTPVKIDKIIYFIDIQSNIYMLKNE